MTEGTDGPVFDEDVVSAVAAEYGVDRTELATLVRRHQAGVDALPGVENLAYEWRKQFEAPVLERTADAYYLAVPASVWNEFGDHLGVEGDELAALIGVHRRQTIQRIEASELDGAEADASERSFVVLDRTTDR